MKKTEYVYRELMAKAEGNVKSLTQQGIAEQLGISISMVHYALQPLREMGAIRVKSRSFEIVSARKILLYWASVRNLQRDIIYQTRVELPPAEIEKRMPGNIIFGAYSAYKFMYNSVPADYSEVYVYVMTPDELKKRFPPRDGPPNLFVLRIPLPFTAMTPTHLFVDLWNIREWYARDFLKELEGRLHGLLA